MPEQKFTSEFWVASTGGYAVTYCLVIQVSSH